MEVRQLLDQGVNPFTHGYNILPVLLNHSSKRAIKGMKKIFEKLNHITISRVDLLDTLPSHISPLHLAIKVGNEDAIDFLIHKGFFLNELNDHGLTCIEIAINENNLKILKYLLENYTSITVDTLLQKNKDGHYIWYLIAMNNDLDELFPMIIQYITSSNTQLSWNEYLKLYNKYPEYIQLFNTLVIERNTQQVQTVLNTAHKGKDEIRQFLYEVFNITPSTIKQELFELVHIPKLNNESKYMNLRQLLINQFDKYTKFSSFFNMSKQTRQSPIKMTLINHTARILHDQYNNTFKVGLSIGSLLRVQIMSTYKHNKEIDILWKKIACDWYKDEDDDHILQTTSLRLKQGIHKLRHEIEYRASIPTEPTVLSFLELLYNSELNEDQLYSLKYIYKQHIKPYISYTDHSTVGKLLHTVQTSKKRKREIQSILTQNKFRRTEQYQNIFSKCFSRKSFIGTLNNTVHLGRILIFYENDGTLSNIFLTKNRESIYENKKTNYFFTISMKMKNSGHANLLIYDNKLKQFFWIEPNGSHYNKPNLYVKNMQEMNKIEVIINNMWRANFFPHDFDYHHFNYPFSSQSPKDSFVPFHKLIEYEEFSITGGYCVIATFFILNLYTLYCDNIVHIDDFRRIMYEFICISNITGRLKNIVHSFYISLQKEMDYIKYECTI